MSESDKVQEPEEYTIAFIINLLEQISSKLMTIDAKIEALSSMPPAEIKIDEKDQVGKNIFLYPSEQIGYKVDEKIF